MGNKTSIKGKITMNTPQKTVLITGANQGIGFEAARQLLELGYFVYLGVRDEEKGKEAVKQLKEDLGHQSVDYLIIDIRDIDSVINAKNQLASKIPYLDALVNNAGIAGGGPPQDASTVSIDLIKEVFETNFYGTIRTTQQFLELLLKAPQPRVVNVSSDMGSLTYHSNPNYKHYNEKIMAYCSSKTAINSFTVMLAYEFRDTPKFKVNSISPGLTSTHLTHFRAGNTVDVGASPIVKYVTIGPDGPTGKFFEETGNEAPW